MRRRAVKGAITLMLIITTAVAGWAAGSQQTGGKESDLGEVGFRPSGLPIVEEVTDLRVMAMRDVFHTKEFDEFPQVAEMEAQTNVHIVWDMVPQNAWAERVNLSFASNDLPEIYFRGINRTMQWDYGTQGMLISLNDLMEQYAPNLTSFYERHPEILPTAVMPDGNIYALPGRYPWAYRPNPDVMLVNVRWLETLGLSIPTTIEDLEEVLRAFKENDPNKNGQADEIPMSFRWGDAAQGPHSLFGMFGLVDVPGDHMTVNDGNVVFTAGTDGHRSGLEWFKDLYEQELVDQEAFVQDVRQYSAKGAQGLYGVFFDWTGSNIAGEQAMREGVYVEVPPLLGPSGERVWWRSRGGNTTHGEIAITSAARYPEVAIRWLDQIAEPLTNQIWTTGPFDYILERGSDGGVLYKTAPEGMGWGEFRHSRSIGRSHPQFWDEEFMNLDPGPAAIKLAQYQTYAPYLEREYFPDVFFLPEEAEELSTLSTDITSFVSQKQAEWVMGSADIDDEWDSYLSRLDQMGLDRFIDIYATAYDRYISK